MKLCEATGRNIVSGSRNFDLKAIAEEEQKII